MKMFSLMAHSQPDVLPEGSVVEGFNVPPMQTLQMEYTLFNATSLEFFLMPCYGMLNWCGLM
jgi:hypothetical protein